ncbi:MAG: hypothetical protein UU52_C0004G0008 [Candidatus Levybacteria bacterium GW2011_GWB1_41_21]|nr:MAG: hypothetical protein UU52_C0004G0008 [Candidatus Levybacteria bacterium GW2011_GWB1_41_21]
MNMRVYVIAHPNAKNERIEKDLLDTFHVYVSEPPIDGRANNAIINTLAKYFEVKRPDVILVSGEKSRNKQNFRNPK